MKQKKIEFKVIQLDGENMCGTRPIALIDYLKDQVGEEIQSVRNHFAELPLVFHRCPQNQTEFFQALTEWVNCTPDDYRQYLYIAGHGDSDGFFSAESDKTDLITWDELLDVLPSTSMTLFGVCWSESIARRCYNNSRYEDTPRSYVGTSGKPTIPQCQQMANVFLETLLDSNGNMDSTPHCTLIKQLNSNLREQFASDNNNRPLIQFTLFE